ncbi:DUF3124 domain-containing protein [Marixanthomonas spongiae]|uniref:DUF3124 domain-containing protein n=1 Tax=Marixanthomonas spongiae TaxID=2174845 RepID=A0A2U0I8K5_9FLAO|nr:DUF3124 domain-containing protein [Marixanthomonas spongiae]PVW17443.1 hypothetical protein DDV96_01205 [Marixanthomonas spongiae]
MKYLSLLALIVVLTSCEDPLKKEKIGKDLTHDWESREIDLTTPDSLLTKGSTYLPIYSEIYQQNRSFTFNLTATVSIRNISLQDTIYIYKADYYNTYGKLIRQYLDHPVYLQPMETIEIVVEEEDEDGGTGANFIFDWATQKNTAEPFFEAVMISTAGQQGLSFTTRGIRKE